MFRTTLCKHLAAEEHGPSPNCGAWNQSQSWVKEGDASILCHDTVSLNQQPVNILYTVTS